MRDGRGEFRPESASRWAGLSAASSGASVRFPLAPRRRRVVVLALGSAREERGWSQRFWVFLAVGCHGPLVARRQALLVGFDLCRWLLTSENLYVQSGA